MMEVTIMKKVIPMLIIALLLVGCGENKTALQKPQAQVIDVAGLKWNVIDSVHIYMSNPRELSAPNETERLFMVMLHVSNESDKAIAVSPFDFLLQTDAHNFYSYTESSLPVTSLDAAELLPEASITGTLTFTIPRNEKPLCLIYEGVDLAFAN